jgi:hypothetical protein
MPPRRRRSQAFQNLSYEELRNKLAKKTNLLTVKFSESILQGIFSDGRGRPRPYKSPATFSPIAILSPTAHHRHCEKRWT